MMRQADRPRPAPDPARQRANIVVVELAEQKLQRAIYSERQLEEVLADFWFNHFNVDARKGRVRFLLTEYEREAIRPHVLGNFRDLLEATAKSPAMLFYLDNWMSADPNGPHLDGPRVGRHSGAGARRPRRGPALPTTAATADAAEPRPKRPQRELRTRADGAPHARRGRRLHAEGRHGGRARFHGMDDRQSARRRQASGSSPVFTTMGPRWCSAIR